METNNSLGLLSKLLATENITITRANVKTASFNIVTRELVLPLWAGLSEFQETLMAVHEVSHALHSTKNLLDLELTYPKRGFHVFVNVVEDARIERLIKLRYPGTRPDFFHGYRQFYEQDFFNISGKIIDDLPLLDRVNLFFKIGSLVLVNFSAEERDIVERIGVAQTELDVFLLSKELYEMVARSKEQQKQKPTKPKKQSKDSDKTPPADSGASDEPGKDEDEDTSAAGSTDDTPESGTADDDKKPTEEPTAAGGSEADSDTPDDKKVPGDGSTNKSSPGTLEPSEQAVLTELTDEDIGDTQHAFDEIAKQHASNIRSMVTVSFTPVAPVRVIATNNLVRIMQPSYAALLDSESTMFTVDFRKQYYQRYAEYLKFKQSNANLVSHMVKEFEMRKSADQYKRTTQAKSGMLASSKLYSYKTNEDLFKKFNVVPDATNHGFVILLDWSSSMSRCLKGVLEQLYTLIGFFRKAGIKFEVLAFTDNISFARDPECLGNPNIERGIAAEIAYQNSFDKVKFQFNTSTSLLKLFTDRMSNADFETVAAVLYARTFSYTLDKRMALGLTPLNQSLQYINEYLGVYRKANAIQKMNLIVMTDGEDSNTRITGPNYSETVRGIGFKPYKSIYVKNDKNSKTYALPVLSYNSVTNLFIKIIRETHPDVNVVGFHIVNDLHLGANKLSRIIPRTPKYVEHFNGTAWDGEMKAMSSTLKSKGIYEMESAYKKFYVISADFGEEIELDMRKIESTDTATQIARKMTASCKTVNSGRILANSLIALIA